MNRCVAIIPARLASTRLPQKLLLRETGKPLIQHTYEAARRASLPERLVVATDHDSIYQVVKGFGGEVVMTDPNAPSGTDRIAEVARSLPEFDIFINVQGDEPDISGEAIDLAGQLLMDDPTAVMATLGTPIRDRQKLEDAACVKLVTDRNGKALYFSRSCIPHARNWQDSMLSQEPPLFYQHIGLYAYRREFLLTISKLPRTPCEIAESLEQLRVLEHGYAIKVGRIDEPAIGIDTPADYQAFVRRWRD